MSKTAYVIRHIHFENAGILEPLLIERGFTLEYIDAPLLTLINTMQLRQILSSFVGPLLAHTTKKSILF